MNHRPTATMIRVALGVLIGAGCGLLGAAFRWGLERAESMRSASPSLLLALPILGLILGAIYERFGHAIAGGNNLIIDRLCDGGPALPKRMVPMNFFGTVAIHLFGGSVGQEGTAMQLGAAWADGLHTSLRLPQALRQACLAAGVAGGFSAVFGTPAAASVFALEFAVAGSISTRLLPSVVVAALTAHHVADYCVATKLVFAMPAIDPLTATHALSWLVFAGCLSLAASLCVISIDTVRHLASRWLPYLPYRMMLGGLGTILFTYGVGSDLYLGGGLNYSIDIIATKGVHVPMFAWLGKLLLTALCLGTGFGGGEVTPLFFMGATLGHVLAPILHLQPAMGAALGAAAILSSATKAPLAWVLFITELMGAQWLPHALLTCTLAAVFSGGRRIYAAQRGHSQL